MSDIRMGVPNMLTHPPGRDNFDLVILEAGRIKISISLSAIPTVAIWHLIDIQYSIHF